MPPLVVALRPRCYYRLLPPQPSPPPAFRRSISPMKNRYDEDLFAGTTMTFGEHLEDLRGALFRAAAGAGRGVWAGAVRGQLRVYAILDPLEGALGSFYSKSAIANYTKWVAARDERGEPAPYTIDDIEHRAFEDEMIFDIQYVDTDPGARRTTVQSAPKSGPAAPRGRTLCLPRNHPPPDPPSCEHRPLRPRPPRPMGLSPTTVLHRPTPNSSADIAAKRRLLPVFLWHPIAEDSRIRAKSFSVAETFGIWIKASLVVGAVISSPWVFYQIWPFVAAGLYPHEKKYVYMFVPFSLGLFLLGAALAFLFVFEPVLGFLLASTDGWASIPIRGSANGWASC